MISTGIAFAFGFFHALEPGHGKTALLTYLASGKKSWKEGAILSVTSAFTHTLSILIIAFIIHLLTYHGGVISKVLGAEHILNFISGFLIVALGMWVIIRSNKQHSSTSCRSCNHQHTGTSKQHYLTLGILGIAIGIMPCPSLIVAYLTGVSSNHAWSGIQSIFFFALGMCISLMAVVMVFSLCSEKLTAKLKGRATPKNWRLIQGIVFIIIGVITAFFH